MATQNFPLRGHTEWSLHGHDFYAPSKLRFHLHVLYESHVSADNVTKQH